MSKSAQFLVVYAAVCWGLVGMWSRILYAVGFSFVEMAAVRSVVTAVCLFFVLIALKRENLKIRVRDFWVFALSGSVGCALCFICYFITAETVTLSATTILLYTAPYMVMIMSAILFKDRITPQKLIALLIAFTGCVMTVGLIGSGDFPLKGILSGLSAALCYALYTIFGKVALQKKYSPVTITAYTYGIAGVILIPFCDFSKIASIVGENSSVLFYLLIFGVFFTLLPYLSYMKGLQRLEASRASIIAFFEPLTAAAAGIIVYDEMLSAIKILGMALIFLALFILNWKPKSHSR